MHTALASAYAIHSVRGIRSLSASTETGIQYKLSYDAGVASFSTALDSIQKASHKTSHREKNRNYLCIKNDIEIEDTFTHGDKIFIVLKNVKDINDTETLLSFVGKVRYRSYIFAFCDHPLAACFIRNLTPTSSITEDPATGSAALFLFSYFKTRYNVDVETFYQLSPEGGVIAVACEEDEIVISSALTLITGRSYNEELRP